MKVIITEEQFSRIFINENRESKNMSIARDVVRRMNSDMDPMRVLNAVRTDIPASREAQCKFLPGVVRMYLEGQINSGEIISRINNTLKILANAHADEYDSNLNGLSAQELIDRFSSAVRNDVESKKADNSRRSFESNDDYNIVMISTPEEASRYAQYTSWCVCRNEEMFNSYTHDGFGVFYFLLKKGFENVPAVEGNNCPLDEYGLSMIAVSVNEDGSLNTVTCRWNHSNGGNDSIMNDEQLSRLIGRDVYQVLKPVAVETVSENERFRVFEKDGKYIAYDKKFEYYTNFDSQGFATFRNSTSVYQSLFGKINLKGEVVADAKYFGVSDVGYDGCFTANLYGLNLVTTDGTVVLKDVNISGASPLGTRRYTDDDGHQGLINYKLKRHIKPGAFKYISVFEDDGRFLVKGENWSCGLLNEDLTFAVRPGEKYRWIDICENVGGGPVRIVEDLYDKYGVIDKDLNEIVPTRYYDINFIDGPDRIIVVYKDSSGKKQRYHLVFENGKYELQPIANKRQAE